jgi:hypothetical protein
MDNYWLKNKKEDKVNLFSSELEWVLFERGEPSSWMVEAKWSKHFFSTKEAAEEFAKKWCDSYQIFPLYK